jgi:DNA-directed RNA polymerase subunit RPC12/RpoP
MTPTNSVPPQTPAEAKDGRLLGAAHGSATGYVCVKCVGGNPIVFRGPRVKCHACGLRRVCVWTELPNL